MWLGSFGTPTTITCENSSETCQYTFLPETARLPLFVIGGDIDRGRFDTSHTGHGGWTMLNLLEIAHRLMDLERRRDLTLGRSAYFVFLLLFVRLSLYYALIMPLLARCMYTHTHI